MLNKLLLKAICFLVKLYINRVAKFEIRKGDYTMKGTFYVKGFTAAVIIRELKTTEQEFNEPKNAETTSRIFSGGDMSTTGSVKKVKLEPIEVFNAKLGIEESKDEIEMDKDEFTHVHDTVSADCKDLRDKIAVPFMETINNLMDRGMSIAEKMADQEMQIKMHNLTTASKAAV